MKIDDDAKVYLFWDAEMSFDPASTTVELEIDDVRYSMMWMPPAAVVIDGKWHQSARTTDLFGGSQASATNSPIKLTAGQHKAQLIISAGNQVVPSSLQVSIDVS